MQIDLDDLTNCPLCGERLTVTTPFGPYVTHHECECGFWLTMPVDSRHKTDSTHNDSTHKELTTSVGRNWKETANNARDGVECIRNRDPFTLNDADIADIYAILADLCDEIDALQPRIEVPEHARGTDNESEADRFARDHRDDVNQ